MPCDPLYYFPSPHQQALWQTVFQMTEGPVLDSTTPGNMMANHINQVDYAAQVNHDPIGRAQTTEHTEAEGEMLGAAWVTEVDKGVGQDAESVSAAVCGGVAGPMYRVLMWCVGSWVILTLFAYYVDC